MLIANMATYPKREETLKQTLPRIAKQVDQLNLVLNEFQDVPAWLEAYPTVHPVLPDDDFKDVGKFLVAPPEDAKAVFLVDDDLIYPADYVVESLKRFKLLVNFHAIMGYHYSVYHPVYGGDDDRIYSRDAVHFGKPRTSFYLADQLGTGTAVLRPAQFPPLNVMMGAQKFVDVRLAKWCFENDIPQIAAPRVEGWIQQAEVEETIFSTFTQTFPPNVDREIMTYALKRAFIGQELPL